MSLPQGSYILTRLVERELVDGKMLAVERSWSCRFEDAGRGMRVNGEQLDCIVRAPAALATLADMERRRTVSGPFPAFLTGTGRIASPIDEQPIETAEAV
ncbi:MAG: hypothetical protein R3E14_06835 [Erythrobacter sp.]